MKNMLVFPVGTGKAISHSEEFLSQRGISLVHHPTPEVTHLLLDIPSREIPFYLLERLPEAITVVGGNLNHPELSGYRKMDLLQNEEYLAKNAAITADCAVRVAAENSQRVFSGSSALVIGWGRIGKCLSRLLKNIGCNVTVAARKKTDRAILEALGFSAVNISALGSIGRYDLLFNTVPNPILQENQLSKYPKVLKIDLASSRGLDCSDVIWARGLPGKCVPESSGKLIAETFLTLCREGTS